MRRCNESHKSEYNGFKKGCHERRRSYIYYVNSSSAKKRNLLIFSVKLIGKWGE
jgi:hypothetical protein